LGTAGLLADDVCAPPLLPEAGAIAVRTPVPDAERLARLAAPPERERWWRARVTRCHAVLGRAHLSSGVAG
jgi:O-succinylbenzoate synthase